MSSTNLNFHFVQVIGSIPTGKVATYGQIARLAGYPGYARQVGATLRKLPRGTSLPWFRVINAQGKSSFPVGTEAFIKQKELLQSEGVALNGDKISLKIYGWQA